MLAEFRRVDTEVAYISNVPLAVFESIQRACEMDRFPFRKIRATYIPSGPTAASGLLMAAPTAGRRHEVACGGLVSWLIRLEVRMGLQEGLEFYGSFTTAVGRSSADPDGCLIPNGRDRTVIFEVANSQSFANAKVKTALWCQLPSIRAIILVETDDEKHVITMTKVVPALRDVGGGPSRYPEAAAGRGYPARR